MADTAVRGYRSGENILRVGGELALWLLDDPHATAVDVQARYGVSRATAFRWLAAARAAVDGRGERQAGRHE